MYCNTFKAGFQDLIMFGDMTIFSVGIYTSGPQFYVNVSREMFLLHNVCCHKESLNKFVNVIIFHQLF